MAAVFLYHADVSWLPAGFLGVDVFFAISGYLICSLLLAEVRRTGTISLRRFWLRRARRLLPALFALLAGVYVAAAVIAPDALPRLRADLPAALGYVSNWWQVVRGESYFESFGRPPLLRHLWSLAVEEQFYLLLPLGLVALARRRGQVSTRLLGLLALGVAAASAVAMAVLWDPGRDPSRVYFGTDTRAVALFAGVALACAWPPGRLRADVPAGARRALDGAGVAALVGLGLLVTGLDEFGGGLYRWGFAATGLASVAAVAVVAHPASRTGLLLGCRPLRWTGTRSYAIYLWHWPVLALTRPGMDVGLRGAPLLALRLAVTGALAEASWRLVEQPVRNGSAGRAWRALQPARRPRLGLAGAVAGLLVVGLSFARPVEVTDLVSQSASAGPATTMVSFPTTTTTSTSPPEPPTTGAPPATAAPVPPPLPTAASVAAAVPTTAAAVTAPPTTAAPPPATASPAPPPPPPVAAPAGTVLAIGDSVMVAARAELEAHGGGRVVVDAAVGRQVDDGLNVLQRYRDNGQLNGLAGIVVHLGTNGPLGPNHFDRLAALVDGVPRVVVVNVRVPRRWEDQSNTSIREGVARHPATMRTAGWHAVSGHPGMLGRDGVHPTRAGAQAYARVIVEQLAP